MIDISGHLRAYKREIGFVNDEVPIEINCCGQQTFLTQDFTKRRPNGRLDYQLIYITKGSGLFSINGSQVTVTAGNIVLYRPHEPQVYSYFCSNKTNAYWIHFTGSSIASLLDQFEIRSGYIGNSIQIKDIFHDMITELQLKKPGFNQIVTADFKKLLVLLQRQLQLENVHDQNDQLLEKLILQLNQNYNKPWTITAMASFCNLSDSYFSHYFKEKTGISPMKYLTDLRMEKAKFLLSESDIPVSGIATYLGYKDVLYFSRIFKKNIGESPTVYRST